MSSLFVFLKQLGFFLEYSWQHSFSISFSRNCVIFSLRLTFFHTAFAICLYVVRANILPKASRTSGSFLSASGLDGQFTLIDASTLLLFLTVICSAESFALSSFTLSEMGETGHRDILHTARTGEEVTTEGKPSSDPSHTFFDFRAS